MNSLTVDTIKVLATKNLRHFELRGLASLRTFKNGTNNFSDDFGHVHTSAFSFETAYIAMRLFPSHSVHNRISVRGLRVLDAEHFRLSPKTKPNENTSVWTYP